MTERFDKSVTKLYTAFHNGTLDAMDCKHCAVGNLCDNNSHWAGGHQLGEEDRITDFDNKTGYSKKELANIEMMFLFGSLNECKSMNTISNLSVKHGLKTKQEQKERQFLGLCSVIEYLAELDGIPNPFDFSKLFSGDKEVAEKELTLIH